jgi:hypothetical protein
MRAGPGVVEQLHGPDQPVRTADDVGAECGLPAWRITEIAERAVERMREMQGQSLAAD